MEISDVHYSALSDQGYTNFGVEKYALSLANGLTL